MDRTLVAGYERSATCAPFERHALAWLEPSERETIYAVSSPDRMHRDALRRWFANDWPLVVRRADSSMRADHVALGLPLPPGEGKRRLCFDVHRRTIARISPPVRLDKAALRLPAPWKMPLVWLATQAAAWGVTLRVFGSVAWQALTGLAYLTPQSDVDLWWQPADSRQLDLTLALIVQWEKRHGVRADGEIAFPGAGAVSWREWHQCRSDERVLAKRIGALELFDRGILAATLVSQSERCSS